MRRLFSGITRVSLRFRWITIGAAVALLALGVWAALRMNQELLPNVQFPQTFILTIRPGASSEDLRDLVTIPLEKEFAAIKGVIPEGLESTTTAPIAFITVRNGYGLNQAAIRQQLQAAIDRVNAAGVPFGLKTTADLTPAIMRQVLTRAPSMWDHFESQHLLAMSPDVLDAALAVNPKFVETLDPLTRDQLAAERVDVALTGVKRTHQPVALPGAWLINADTAPKTIAFDLSDLPVIEASVFGASADMSPEALRALVDKEIVAALKEGNDVKNVADVKVSGGQQIPDTVRASAEQAVAKANASNGNSASTDPSHDSSQNSAQSAQQPTPQPTAQAQQSTPQPTQPVAPKVETDQSGVPLLPDSWRTPVVRFQLGILQLNTADDLLHPALASGEKRTAAQIVSQVADTTPLLVRDLTPAIIGYVRQREQGFAANLSDKALGALSAEAYAAVKDEKVAPALSSAWTPLLNQQGFKTLVVASVRDLLKVKGGAAAVLNAIVRDTPANLQDFAIRLISSLTPEAVDYLVTYEKDFLVNLDPQVLRYMSAEALKSLPTGFWDSLKDDQLKADLQAIIADPGKAAAATLKDSGQGKDTVADDPNAPPLPKSWADQLKPFGVNVVKADDLLRHPAGQKSAADFINLLADRNASALIGQLSADVLLYIQQHDATFFTTLKPTTLGMLSKETLAKLPEDVRTRVESGPAFIAASTITRTNGEPALTIAIYKNAEANTVLVSDEVERLLDRVKANNKNISISTIFEQASFIKDSISGVAREGGLGAVMAVVVILLFLNFSFRSTLVTAVSIPTSIAIAFALMYLLPSNVHQFLTQPGVASAIPEGVMTFLLRLFPASLTLNIMTLSGLTVAIGRVVDDSIVVLENIYRQIQTGISARDAVLRGTRDVSVAIFAATLTTVVVFLPIGLAGGLVGEFFMPFGLAVTYSLAASFVVAITIVPVLAYLFISRKNVPEEKEGRLASGYRSAIEWALSHRWAVLGVAAVTLAIGMALFANRPTTFLPALGEPQITVTVSLPAGTPIAQTDVRVRELEDYLKTLTANNSIRKYQVTVGSGGGLESFVGGSSINGAAAQIAIAPNTGSSDQLTALTAQIRARAETIFGAPKYVKVSKASMSEQGFGGFAVVLTGPQEDLNKLNDDVIKTLSTVPGLANVTSSMNLVAGATSTTYLRINQTASVQFSGELETQNTLGVTQEAIQKVQKMPNLPPTVTVGEGFQSQEQTKGFAQMLTSLAIAVVIVYFVMVITLGSVVQPFTILFSLPLAVVGAALGLTLTNRVLGISAMIGMLMLVGIVVTNAIVLIDRVQANRKERGMSAREALVEGGRTRLRPILMTAIATMFALLPLAIGLSEGAIIASELGTVVIGGLFSSTLLTLLVVPVVYSLLDGAQRKVMRQPVEAPSPAIGD